MSAPRGWGRRFRLPYVQLGRRKRLPHPRGALIFFLAALPAFGQFDLQVIDAAGVRPAPSLYDFGAETAARFRLRNISSITQTAKTISIAGANFSLNVPALPVALDPQGVVDFGVSFAGIDVGSYSAVLRAENVTIILTASVQPSLTWRVDGAPLASGIDFGSVVRGNSVRRRLVVLNETATLLIVPPIAVQGSDFALAGPSPGGTLMPPSQYAEFAIDFAPTAAGARQGRIVLGDRGYALTGTATEPPLPKPSLTIDLKQPWSAAQGMLRVGFDKPAATSGAGAVTLDFRGAADPTVTLANGARTATFAVSPGDTGFAIGFQTGTTAGTLVFTVALGGATEQASVQIPTLAPALNDVQGTRSGNSIDIRITGYDNTRSVSQTVFIFYDAAGTAIAPGAVRVDASGEFSRFFAGSDMGGVFLFHAVFPVTGGDASQVAAFDLALTDLIGTTRSSRITLQ